MRCSLDKVLLDARQLANKIRATDETADILIKQASDAHNKIIAKKQCQEEIMSFEQLNQMSKSRPRSRLMMCIAAENKQLELLRQENKVLRTSLSEYETTFEMIMKKFRKHKNILKKLDQMERGDFTEFSHDFSLSTTESIDPTENQILLLCSKISQLQKSIEKALIVDNRVTDDLSEIETKLSFENQELRRLIEINEEFKNSLQLHQQSIHENVRSHSFSSSSPPPPSSQNRNFRIAKLESHNSSNTVAVVNGGASCSKCSKGSRVIKTLSSSTNKSPCDLYSSNSNSTTATFSDDDDDHSSQASDASVKTLI